MEKQVWWENLQPLRIPPGWEFVLNKLENLEPETLTKDDRRWLFSFVEDILYLYSKPKQKRNKKTIEQTIGIDLGWYPDGQPDGHFRLIAILDNHWENPLLEFTSRRKEEVVKTLERWLFVEFCPLQIIDETRFRKSHSIRK